MESENPKSRGPGGCLARLFWMGLGNLILVLSAVAIFQNQAGFTLTGMDALLWSASLSLLAVRFVDIRYLAGETTDSQPASMADWRRYAATVLGVSFALWLGAHLLS